MRLLAAVCASLFGRGSDRPYRAAAVRLTAALSAAAAVSIVLAKGLSDVPSGGDPEPQLAYAVVIATEIAVLLPLLSAAGLTRDRTDNLNRLLLTLPLRQASRSAALLMPGLSVALLSLALAAYPLSTVALAMGLPWLLLPGSLIAGTMAAFGLAYGMPSSYWRVQAMCVPIVIWGQYKLSGIVGNAGLAPEIRNYAAAALLLFVLLPVLLSARSGHELTTRLSRACAHRDIARNGLSMPYLWFAQKMWRNRTTRMGLAMTLSISMAAAFIAWRQNMVPHDMYGTLAAMLAAAFCSDARALSRRGTPSEIVGLKGTRYFLTHYLVITGCLGLLAVSPLLALLFRLAPPALPAGLLQVGIGMSAGIFSGTLLAAGQRDVLAQYGASLLSLSVLLFPAQLPLLAGFTVSEPYVFYGALILTLLTASVTIEYKRNMFIWRVSYAR